MSHPRNTSANSPGNNFGKGCARFWENWPIIGHIMSLVYWIQGKPYGEPERAAVWASFGLVPFFNCWRCGIACFRHWWCCGNPPVVPSDCSKCRLNHVLNSQAGFEGPEGLQYRPLVKSTFPAWMQHPEVQNKLLTACAIPASHDAAAYTTANVGGLLRSWSICQYESLYGQLNKGARWFDLRLRDAELNENVKDPCLCGKKPGKTARFWAAHTFLTCPLEPVARETAKFFEKEESSKEIVIFTMKPDYPTKLDNSAWRQIYELFLSFFPEEKFITRDDLSLTIGELQAAGKQILLLVDGCYCGDRSKDNSITSLVEQRGILVGSWSKTNTDCPTELQDKATSWLKSAQSALGGKTFYMLQAELTPTTPLVLSSILYMKPSVDTFLNMEDQACAAHRVLRSSMYNPGPWQDYNFNVVSHDFVSAEICSLIIMKNFSDEKVQKAFLEGREYPHAVDSDIV